MFWQKHAYAQEAKAWHPIIAAVTDYVSFIRPMFTNALLYAALLPLVTSASIAFIMRQLRSPLQIAWPVATTAGFLTAQFTLRGQSGFSESLYTFFQPHVAVDWLPHIVLLTLGVSIVMYLAPTHRPLLIALAVALCLTAPVRLLSGNVAQHWPILEKFAVLFLLATVLGIVWLLLMSNVERQPSILPVPLLILVAVGTAIVLTQSGVLTYGLASAALGAAITGTAVAFGFRRIEASSGTAATAGILTFTLGSLIILGHFYAELTTINAALLFVSLVATAAPLPALLRNGPAWRRNAARVICCLVPLAIAVGTVMT